MIKATLIVALVLLVSLAVFADTTTHTAGWKSFLRQELPILGHRNWIVVADSAYPAQNSPGIITVETGATQIEVVQEVLRQLGTSKHVSPILYVDAELKHLSDKLCPGIEHYKKDLDKVLHGRPVQGVLHSDLIAKLDEAGKTFKVVILKTSMTLPYTTVFFNLDCKYWGPAKEKQLREIIKKHMGG
jgi:L-fucose mutarotase/ribose pyranase (RbsD/FucU family)